MGLLAFYFVAALVVSFVCSLLEAVILSITPAYVESLVKEGHKSGKLLKELKDRVDRPLTAILSLNTIANTLGAAGVGAESLRVWGERWVAAASGVMTLSILVAAEIIPKTLGAAYWKQLAPAGAYGMKVLMFLMYPLVICFEALSRSLSGKGRGRRITREEMAAAVEIGHREGALHSQENRVIQNLLALNRMRAKEVMTPRSVILAYPKDETVGSVVETRSPLRFSRIPIYGKNLDEVTGVVHRTKILQEYSKGELEETLQAIALPIYAVPETKTVASALDEFIKRREHLFLVVDEYGGTAGIITLEDAIETLLGVEIVGELDPVEDMRKFAQEMWERRKKGQEL